MGTSLSSTRSVSSGTLGLSAMLGLAFSFGILEMIGGFVKVDCGTGRSYRLGGRGCWKTKMLTLYGCHYHLHDTFSSWFRNTVATTKLNVHDENKSGGRFLVLLV